MTNRIPTVLSALALTVSLTGAGAYAATQINGSNIKNGTISAAKLTKSARASLTGKAGAPGSDGMDGYSGADGYDGADGRPGEIGAAGGFDPSKIKYYRGPNVTLGISTDPSSTDTAMAVCPAGSKVIAGGYDADDEDGAVAGVSSFAASGAQTAWLVILHNTTAAPVTAWAYAVCVTA
jgi:hypothetical protein